MPRRCSDSRRGARGREHAKLSVPGEKTGARVRHSRVSRHVVHVEAKGLPTPGRLHRQRRIIAALSEQDASLDASAGGAPSTWLRPIASFGFSMPRRLRKPSRSSSRSWTTRIPTGGPTSRSGTGSGAASRTQSTARAERACTGGRQQSKLERGRSADGHVKGDRGASCARRTDALDSRCSGVRRMPSGVDPERRLALASPFSEPAEQRSAAWPASRTR